MLLAAAMSLAAIVPAQAQTPIVTRFTSRVLGELREITVRLPASYARDRQRRYPVAYVLDGAPLDAHTFAGATQLASTGEASELIVVGIPNMHREGRARDFLPPFLSFPRRDGTPFTGGADRFLRFLREELTPRIERTYRTARPRLLVGHSLGAIFVCYSLMAAPAFFDARFAHSPAIWRDEDVVAGELARWLAAARGLGSFFYVSVGAREGDGLGHSYDKLKVVLGAHATAAGLRWQADITPGAVHETNVALATAPSLRVWRAVPPRPQPRR